MLKSSQFIRSAAIALTVASIGPSTAMAIPSSQALPSEHASDWSRPASAAAAAPEPSTPARVESMGVRPAAVSVPAPATQAVPLTKADNGGGVDPLLIGIAGAGLLVLLLTIAVLRTDRQLTHPFRARQV